MSARAALALLLLGLAGPALGQSFGFSSDQPIEITADSLEVVQADRVATFSGNVDAVQGDLVLSADELLVHYRGGGEPAAPDSAGAIRRIEARGNVVVTSPRETAEGAVGVYDVGAAMVTLEGAVVLTRDDNVVRGDRLELNLATGVSRVIATTTAAGGAAPGGRVRAVFVPDDEGSSRDDPAPTGGVVGEGSSSTRDQPAAAANPGAPPGGAGPPRPEIKPDDLPGSGG